MKSGARSSQRGSVAAAILMPQHRTPTRRLVRKSTRISFNRSRTGVLLTLLLFLLGCGSKTDLEVYDFDLDGATPECFRNFDCRDSLACTDHLCRGGLCEVLPVDERCEDELVCTVGRCDPDTGCQQDALICDDGIECTVDECAEPNGCSHTPDDLRCPVSFRCDAERGCVAQALVNDANRLYRVDLPSGATEAILEIDSFTDIALGPDRTLYACTPSQIFRLDRTTGAREFIIDAPSQLVALEIGPDGALYAAALDEFVLRFDLSAGTSEVYGELPRGWAASGDIAFVEGRMLITVTDEPASRTGENQLAEVMTDGSSRLIARLPATCLWGVAAFGRELYAFSCAGALLSVDPDTGASVNLGTTRIDVQGAAAR